MALPGVTAVRGALEATPGTGSSGFQLREVPRAPPAAELLQWGARGGPLFTSGDGLVFLGGLPPQQPSRCREGRPQLQGAGGDIPVAGGSGTLVPTGVSD